MPKSDPYVANSKPHFRVIEAWRPVINKLITEIIEKYYPKMESVWRIHKTQELSGICEQQLKIVLKKETRWHIFQKKKVEEEEVSREVTYAYIQYLIWKVFGIHNKPAKSQP